MVMTYPWNIERHGHYFQIVDSVLNCSCRNNLCPWCRRYSGERLRRMEVVNEIQQVGSHVLAKFTAHQNPRETAHHHIGASLPASVLVFPQPAIGQYVYHPE